MKNVNKKEESDIIIKLISDIEQNPKNPAKVEELNSEAIKKIYTSEECRECRRVVSMLENGLCGACSSNR